jgi:SHS2 domain-containing protein
MYETFEHTADLGLRVTAADLPELFCEAARGLFSIIVADPKDIVARQQERIEIVGQHRDELLFDWLSELLYLFESRRLLLADFEVEIDAAGLRAVVRGEPWTPDRHPLEHEVKAITYHGLKVEPTDGGWLAEVIVDI